MKLIYFLSVVFSLLTSSFLFANNYGDISFETVGDNNLIPQGIVTELFQDKQGYIWIGSQRGLIRYDGYNFKHFKHTNDNTNEISGNFISKVTQCHNGYLWIGTKNDGISVFDPTTEKFIFYIYSEDSERSLAHNKINDIIIDKSNNKWIATPKGLNYQEEGKKEFQLFTEGLTTPYITALLIDANETLWIGTKQGLFTFNAELKKIIPYNDKNDEISIYANLVVSVISQSDNGDIWIGTKDTGLIVLSKQDKKTAFTHINGNGDDPSENSLSDYWVSSIIQASSEHVWVSMFGGGIDIISITTKKVVERIKHDISISDSLNLNSVSQLMLDHSGLLWIGTWGGGLNKYDTQQTAFRKVHYSPTRKTGLSHPDIASMLELQDGRWLIGTAGNGIDLFDASFKRIGGIRHKVNQKGSLPLGGISSLAQTADGKVWVGIVNHGLYELDISTFKLTNYTQMESLKNANIYRITVDHNNLWIGTRFGAYYFDREALLFSPILDEQNMAIKARVSSIAIDKKRNAWIGTENGLYYKKQESKKARHFIHDKNNKSTISSNHISGILVDSVDRVWVDTGAGLNRLISLNQSEAIFESTSDKVNEPGYYFGGNLLEDDQGRIWTQWSLLNPDINAFFSIIGSIGTDIGTAWVNSFTKSKSGLLLFGGTKGILIISPQGFVHRSYRPALAVTNFTIDGKPSVLTSQKIVLEPGSQRLSLELTAFDYFKPEANKYKYKLEGYNSHWVYTSANNRHVTFTNLPVGEYKLKLQGAGPSSNWSEKGIELLVIVEPALYQTTIFYIVVILVLCGLLFTIYLLRVNHLKRYQYVLEQQVLQRTKELKLSNNNLNIISEIGKEITSTIDLTSVLDKIYSHSSQLMDAYIFNIGIFNKNDNTLDVALSIKDDVKLPFYQRDLSNKQQLSVWCIDRNQSILINNSDTELADYLDIIDWKAINNDHCLDDVNNSKSHLYIPLNLNDEVIGVISVHSQNESAFDNTQLEMMKMLANYAAIAIDNANKLQQIKLTNQSLITVHSKLKASYNKIKKISQTDQLTGLKNRHFLRKYILTDVKKLLRSYGKLPSLKSNTIPDDDMIFFLIDLDHFKRINDTFGHSAGDNILKSMKDILSGIFRETDYLIRWGGEEFLVIARFTNREQAPILAERIRTHVEDYKFKIETQDHIAQTCSIGFACFPFLPQQPEIVGWEQVIEVADICLYAAKNTQRNAWVGMHGNNNLKSSTFVANLIEDPNILLKNKQVRLEASIAENIEICWKRS